VLSDVDECSVELTVLAHALGMKRERGLDMAPELQFTLSSITNNL
jgi:hypothetical protein